MLVGKLVMRPLRGRADALGHVLHLRERGRKVEVRHRDVGVSSHDVCAVGLQRSDAVGNLGRTRSTEQQVAA